MQHLDGGGAGATFVVRADWPGLPVPQAGGCCNSSGGGRGGQSGVGSSGSSNCCSGFVLCDRTSVVCKHGLAPKLSPVRIGQLARCICRMLL